MLFGPEDHVAGRIRRTDRAEVHADQAARSVVRAGPVTLEDEGESWINAKLRPTRPPRKLPRIPVTGPDEDVLIRSSILAPAKPPRSC